jgi:HlyD family secretion protein
VELGCIDASLSASGVVVPEYEQVVTSPVRSTVVEVLRQSGDTVGAAQSIVRLDTEAAEFRVKQFRDQLNFHENQKRQLILELERREIDLAAYRDIKEMEVKFLESQLETVRKLNKLGGTAGEELTQAELNLDIARRQLLQLTRTVENQKTSLLAEIEGLDLQIQMKENEVRESERDLDLACARAERAGVVTWVNDNIGSYVGPGDVVARVADLSSYRIEAQISDMHAARLVVGGKVVVRVGDTRLRGIISAVKPSVENGIARFDVRLEDNDHSSLRPNLRTDVDVITSFKYDVLRVASGPFYKNRVDQKVFVIDGDQAIRRTIDIGLTNYDYVELIGDIQAGDEMVISDMSKYEHAGQVAITD